MLVKILFLVTFPLLAVLVLSNVPYKELGEKTIPTLVLCAIGTLIGVYYLYSGKPVVE